MPEQKNEATHRYFNVWYGGGTTTVRADFYLIDGSFLHFYRGEFDLMNPMAAAKALSSTFKNWDKVTEVDELRG